jgi:hypothetical protein
MADQFYYPPAVALEVSNNTPTIGISLSLPNVLNLNVSNNTPTIGISLSLPNVLNLNVNSYPPTIGISLSLPNVLNLNISSYAPTIGISLSLNATITRLIKLKTPGYFINSYVFSLSSYSDNHVFVVEGFNYDTVTTEKFYFSTYANINNTEDSSTIFIPKLKDLGMYQISMYNGSDLGGSSKMGHGQLKIVNIDGEFDHLINYAFKEYSLNHYITSVDSPDFPGDFTLVESGVIESVNANFNTLEFTFKDKQYLLDKPHSNIFFEGNNVLPYGLEGEKDLQDKQKPRVYGQVYNKKLVCVNTSELIYQISDNYGTNWDSNKESYLKYPIHVYDNSIEMETVFNLPDPYFVNTFIEYSPESGAKTYVYNNYDGYYLKLGAREIGSITADTYIPNNYGEGIGALIHWILLDAGIDSLQIDSSVKDMFSDYYGGISVSSGQTTRDIIDKLCVSIGAFWYFDKTGVFKLQKLITPNEIEGEVSIIITSEMIKSIEVLYSDDAYSVPPNKIIVKYRYNETVESPKYDEFKQVSDDPYDYYKDPTRVSEVSKEWLDLTYDIPYSGLKEYNNYLEAETQLYDIDSAQKLLDRLVEVFGTKRNRYKVTVLSTITRDVIIGDTIMLKSDRFECSEGKLVVIISKKLDYNNSTTELILWG